MRTLINKVLAAQLRKRLLVPVGVKIDAPSSTTKLLVPKFTSLTTD